MMRYLTTFLLFLSFFVNVTAADGLSLKGLSIEYDRGTIKILDQQKLPAEEEWITVETPEQMFGIIRALKVRGAPLIGIAAIFSLAKMAEEDASADAINDAANLLRESRPTAVNLAHYLDRILENMKGQEKVRDIILTSVEEIFNEDVALCDALSEYGAVLIQPEENILTYCNTGSLACAGSGTALGVIKKAHSQGKNIHVYVCETRPLLQGGRLTAWELEKEGVPYTLICDNMAASLMAKGKVNRVLLGADRIAINGDTANKIGTYSVAVLAHFHNVPFHVVAPYTTIDPLCASGDMIKIEERAPHEVRGAAGSFGNVCWSPKNAPVYNPAFDVAPAELVTSYILDKGNLSASELSTAINGDTK